MTEEITVEKAQILGNRPQYAYFLSNIGIDRFLNLCVRQAARTFERGSLMREITRVGVDLAKSVIQVTLWILVANLFPTGN
jgi:hypothetical protein